MTDAELLRRAVELAVESARAGGGPFGAVVAKDGVVVATGANQVVQVGDPTAHAEIAAIRAACRELDTHVLAGTVMYSSCEPCPMCLAACVWARVDRAVFAASRFDAAAAGFDDAALYDEMAAPLTQRRMLPIEQLLAGEASRPFSVWAAAADRAPY
ncbi:MAG: nucleoside deaminase [Jiangellaceae bacterium]